MSTFTPQFSVSAGLAPPAHALTQAAPLAEASEITLACLIIGNEAMVDETPAAVSSPSTSAKIDPVIAAEVKKLLTAAQLDHIAGRKGDLKTKIEKILELQPTNAQAYFNLGVLKRDEDKLPEAEGLFRRAIQLDPRNTQYHLALGELMQLMRHLLFAAEAYEKGLEIDPNHEIILTNLIAVRQKQRMPDKVAEISQHLLALRPQSVTATLSLAWGLLWLGQTEEAAEAAGRALSLDPKSIQAAVILQICLKRLGRIDAAAAALHDITARSLELWNTCSQAADAFNQFEEGETAEAILRAVIERQPNFVPALLQLGRYRILSSDLTEGERLMARVAELDPEEGDAQTSVSLTKIRNGEYAIGWASHHWRWKRTGCEPRWDIPVPAWNGEALADGSLIIWREQGIGDMIMYAAPAIACRGLASKVFIETNPRLQPLLQRSFPDMVVICREDISETYLGEQNIVAQCPIGELPHLLHVDMAHYPGKNGFLIANPEDASQLRDRYRLLFPGKKLIGISWRSGNSSSAITRSIELPHWIPILETPDCAFISLQYGDISRDIEDLRQLHGLEVYIDTDVNPMQNMDLFAAQINAMDLVISVDNSTVHVAGALGKQTWVLVPAAADWRWLTPDRTDCAWYSSLELFRCIPQESWFPVIARVAERLKECSIEALGEQRRQQYLRSAKQAETYGNVHTGELYYRAVLVEAPGDHTALAGLGQVALTTGHAEDAIGLLRRAVETEPRFACYWRDYAQALLVGGRLPAAAISLREALAIDREDQAALELGIKIQSALKAPEEVGNFCARLLRLDPEHREARLHLAALQASNGDFVASEVNFARVLQHHPDDAVASFSLGCLALRRGDYISGWRGYARRFDAGLRRLPANLAIKDVTHGVIGGTSLKGQRLAVRPEATLRDQIMFIRWLKSVRQEADFVAAEIDPRLIPLLSGAIPGVALFPTGSLSDTDAIDLELNGQVWLADLSARYASDTEALGTDVPYLQFDLGKAAALRQDYRAALSCDRLVGLCWRGTDLAVPLQIWAPILRKAGYGFVSLQVGPAQQEFQEVFGSLDLQAVRDPSIDAQSNLRGYAAQMAAMDLVITVDDVPAHLAGALGVTTACLLPQVADWRWLEEDRGDTPWYPSMHLYRQTIDGNWNMVLEKIAAEMDELVECSKGGGRHE